MRFIYPTPGTRVPSRKFSLQIAVDNFRLVRANQAPRPGEGHLHVFIDVPHTEIGEGQLIPLDQPQKYLHIGAPPYDRRSIELAPGVHTLTAVMADSAHLKILRPAPVSVTFLVQE